jgi:hypothetical protein
MPSTSSRTTSSSTCTGPLEAPPTGNDSFWPYREESLAGMNSKVLSATVFVELLIGDHYPGFRSPRPVLLKVEQETGLAEGVERVFQRWNDIWEFSVRGWPGQWRTP